MIGEVEGRPGREREGGRVEGLLSPGSTSYQFLK